MFRKRSTWIIFIVAVVLIGGGIFLYLDRRGSTEAAEDEAAVQTTIVRQGDITISATGAGTVIPATEITLDFGSTGVLVEVLVQVGDRVNEGDVLARLDDSDARQALANAELSFKQATMQTDGSATETGVSYDDIAVQQAQLNLDNTQATLDVLLNWEADEDEIALAELNLQAAQASYAAAKGQEASASYSAQISLINLEQAQRDLAAAQENYDNAWSEGREWETQFDEPICSPGEPQPCTGQTWADRIEAERSGTESALVRAQDSLTIAEANYNSTIAGNSNSSSANAQSSILNAQITLEAARSGPSDEEIEAAQTAVRQAELSLQQALLNQESDKLSLAQAQLNLESAQAAVEETSLVAPMDGTIMAVNGAVGESAGAGFITMADLEQPLLEIYLDETDLDKVGVGFDVDVIFDALPDDIFTGQVVQVDPMLSSLNGVSTVRALVRLDEASYAKPQNLPVGLNATVDVIGGRSLGALLVPVEALREISTDNYAVFVMEDGEPKLRFVEVGLMDFTYAEILSGLEVGDTVTTGIVETN